MPELNFKITGDDSELKKTLANIAKVAKENGDRISKEVLKSTDIEVKSREKAVKATQDQKKASDDVVKGAQAEAAAQDKVTEAVKKKNAAFDANGRQIRPIQMSNSQDEINAANSGKVGTITNGPVVGSVLNWNKLANEAASYGEAAKQAHNAAVIGANATVKSNEDIRKAIRSLKIDAQSYKNIAESTKDSERLAIYNKKLQDTQAEITRLRNVGKAGFDELGNKVSFAAGKMEVLNNKLRMYQSALTKANAPQSFVNLNRKIQDTEGQINRLKNAGKTGFDEMGNAVAKSTNKVGAAWQGVKSLANLLPGVGIAGLIAFASEPIIEYIKNLEIFKKSAKSIASDTAIDSSEYKSAVSNVTALKTSIDDYHKGLLTGKQVVKEYNDGIGRTAGELKNVAEVENFYNSKADKFVEAMYLRAQAQAALITSTDLLAEAQKRAANGTTIEDYGKAFLKTAITGQFGRLGNIINDGSDIKNAAVEDLNKKGRDAINLFKNLQTASDKFNKTNGFNFNQDKSSSTGINSIITQQESLQKRIDEINKEYTRKSLTKDEEELQAVRDKFKKIADEAAKFNANPKNRLHLVDTTGLDTTRDNAIKDLVYKQTTERTKIDLDKQKALYAEYEDYKTKLGQSAADKRFAKELNAYITYLDVLKAKQKEITDIAPEKRTGGQKDYLTWLETQIKAEVEVEKKKNDALVKEFITYSDKRKAVVEKYEADIAALSGNTNAQAERTTRYKEDLASLDDANVQKLDAYKALFKGIENLSDDNARKVISNAKNMLDTLLLEGKISKELADQIGKLIGSTTAALKDRMPDRLISLANDIDGIADAVGNVDAGFGKMLSTLSNVVGQVGNIKSGMNDLKVAQGKGANGMADFSSVGQLSAGLGIFGAGLSIISTVTKLFSTAAEREAQAAYGRDIQNKQTEALTKSLERQLALINDVYGTERLEQYNKALKDIAATEAEYRKQLNGKYMLTGNKQYDDWLAKLNAGEKLTGGAPTDLVQFLKQMKNGGFDTISGSLGLEELNELLDSGKLDTATAKIVQGLIDVEKQYIQTKNALDAETIGSSLDTIADDFVKNLTDGTQDFGKSFEDIIRTSILNGFKGKLIEQQLQAFYTQFAQATADGNLSEDEITKLRAAYLAASEKAKADFDALGKATGIDLTDSGTTKTGISGQIVSEALKEDTANRLLGIAQGHYDIAKQNGLTAIEMLNLSKRGIDIALAIEANTFRGANNTDGIGSKLDQIIINTKPSGESLDQALRNGGVKN